MASAAIRLNCITVHLSVCIMFLVLSVVTATAQSNLASRESWILQPYLFSRISCAEAMRYKSITDNRAAIVVAADKGDPDAMMIAAYLSDPRCRVGRDTAAAQSWYQRAAAEFRSKAQAGDAHAMLWMGYLTLTGRGVPQNVPEGLSLIERAANMGSTSAMITLAERAQSQPEAVEWFRRAAEAGDTQAMRDLAKIFETGRRGVPQNLPQALEWYRRAAEAGDTWAMLALATRLESGSLGARDRPGALAWTQKAADLGNASAILALGLRHREGRDGPRNLVQAAALFKRAADLGEEAAMYQLAGAYRFGEGVSKSDRDSTAWYRRAADAGSRDAMNALGWAYEWGIGIQKSLTEARRWYEAARSLGHVGAINNLRNMGRGSLSSDLNTRLLPQEQSQEPRLVRDPRCAGMRGSDYYHHCPLVYQ